MLLVVDVGNTQTHLGVYDGPSSSTTGASPRCASRPPTSSGAALTACSPCAGFGFADIDASIVSATVPSLRPQWTAMASRYLGHEMLLVGPGLRPGCRSATTTRARSAPTGSSTPSPATSASAAPA